MEITQNIDLEPLLPIEFLTELTEDTLSQLKTYTVLLDQQNTKAILKVAQSQIDHAVCTQIPVLRQFAADLLADLHRYIDHSNLAPSDRFIFQVYSQLVTIYDNIYNITTLKEALITRGKLQFIHACLKKETS